MRLCEFDGCDKKHKGHGLCQGHLVQQRKGKELTPLRLKLNNGFRRSGDGYIELFLPDYPWSKKSGHVLEHRWAMEQHLGRRLKPHENVHHKNGVRDDNRLENLELWVVPQPTGQRLDDLLDWLVEHYQDEIIERVAK